MTADEFIGAEKQTSFTRPGIHHPGHARATSARRSRAMRDGHNKHPALVSTETRRASNASRRSSVKASARPSRKSPPATRVVALEGDAAQARRPR